MKTDFSAELAKLRSELNGDTEHDREVLLEWGERYRGKPEAKPLLKEIGRILFSLDADETARLTENVLDKMRDAQERAFSEAVELCEQGKGEQARQRLASVVETAVSFPLSEDYVWADFDSYFDAALFQDYFAEEIDDREIARHPLAPAQMLFFYGGLLIDLGRVEEAVSTLEYLLTLDPVCTKYLFELGDAYKRVGRLQDAYNMATRALYCAADGQDAARAYRDAAYCLAETGDYDNASALYQLSLQFDISPRAEAELAWIAQQTGKAPVQYTEEELILRCQQLQLPVGMSDAVRENLRLLETLDSDSEEENF